MKKLLRLFHRLGPNSFLPAKERVEYYLGKELYHSKKPILVNDDSKMKIAREDLIDDDLKKNKKWVILKNLLLKYNHADKFFLFKPGDMHYLVDKYAFVKVKVANDKTILLKHMEGKRHWRFIYNKPEDLPFDQKSNTIFWRGATTGNPNKPANRFTLVTKWFEKHPSIDVAFSDICQSRDVYKPYMKERVHPKEFLKHKYILSVRGNDKDSGLNWKLNSNSLVLMARPMSFSWLMEDKLIPGVHYVLLKDDFSDLEEKLNWCNQHQNECKKIVRNANEYMKQFMDTKKERKIEKKVIDQYFKKVQFI